MKRFSDTTKGYVAALIALSIALLLTQIILGAMSDVQRPPITFARLLLVIIPAIPALAIILLPVHMYCRERGLYLFQHYAKGVFLTMSFVMVLSRINTPNLNILLGSTFTMYALSQFCAYVFWRVAVRGKVVL